MKTLISSLFLLIGISAFAQLPNKFNFQGIVRRRKRPESDQFRNIIGHCLIGVVSVYLTTGFFFCQIFRVRLWLRTLPMHLWFSFNTSSLVISQKRGCKVSMELWHRSYAPRVHRRYGNCFWHERRRGDNSTELREQHRSPFPATSATKFTPRPDIEQRGGSRYDPPPVEYFYV
jgi:hypothetical protein